MNLDHHFEQMEAARAQFNKLWTEILLPKAISFGATQSNLDLIQIIAWHAFSAAISTTPPSHPSSSSNTP